MKYTTLTFLMCVLCVGIAHAEQPDDSFSAFRSMETIAPMSIVVPTVVEVPVAVASREERSLYAVYDYMNGQFLPYFVHDVYTQIPTNQQIFAEGNASMSDTTFLTDGKSDTSIEYYLGEEEISTVRFTIVTPTPMESSSLRFALDRYVALPTTVSVSARVNGMSDQTVLAQSPLYGTSVFFPTTRASQWTITLTYVQPLRLRELTLVEDSVQKTMVRGVRFLAQPNASYALYLDADRYVDIDTPEAGNLRNDTGVLLLPPQTPIPNGAYDPLFVPVIDVDTDGVPDTNDNCPHHTNVDQKDIDKNGRGDVCDDFDRDGRIEAEDNCPTIPNVAQEDEDSDGIGDVCDGEESRFTEKYVWVPWVGMGIALFVIGILFVLVLTTPKRDMKNEEDQKNPSV